MPKQQLYPSIFGRKEHPNILKMQSFLACESWKYYYYEDHFCSEAHSRKKVLGKNPLDGKLACRLRPKSEMIPLVLEEEEKEGGDTQDTFVARAE